jgi:glycosyltransferase involved in cell wall biosynthesis
MSGKPLLSIVMPVHDGAEWIGATLESVAAEPMQSVELIVIDSSPNDDTALIVERYADRLPLQLLRRPDLKPWQAKTNMGVELAVGEYCCILHQDDLWLPGRVGSVRRWIAGTPDAVESQFILQRLLVQNFISVPAPVFRRSAWLECGGMDDQLWYTPDWDIWVKLSRAGLVVYHDELTTAFRLHGSSLTVTGSRDLDDFRAQMKTVVDRHLGSITAESRRAVERLARASIDLNVSLAAASAGSATALARAAGNLLSLGPFGMFRYLTASRLRERVLSRVRARMRGAF